jgi:hypothetical protein
MIGNILREFPKMPEITQPHFGGHCLKRPGFKIQTLKMVCILFGIDQKRLFKELEDLRS